MRQEEKKGLAHQYEEFTGKRVRIYYQDMRGTNRSLIGTITSVKEDCLWLANGEWRGCLNCANAKICIISTTDGWNAENGAEFKDFNY